jgi:soluble P-type ATPase
MKIEIPGFGDLQTHVVCSDYTATLSCEGKLLKGVKERLRELATMVDVHCHVRCPRDGK